MIRLPIILTASILLVACQSGAPGASKETVGIKDMSAVSAIQSWGGMRDVLRNGNTQGRVKLADVVGPHTIAVGALEGLGAEITIVNGDVQLAEVTNSDANNGLHVRGPNADDKATLLVLANVPEWTEHALPPVANIAELEGAIREIVLGEGLSFATPFPFRVEGTAAELHVHVLNHSCPIANPEGPEPWRFTGTDKSTILVGFYAQDAAGVLTHHGQNSHIHAVLREENISGHVDGYATTETTRLFLPAQ